MATELEKITLWYDASLIQIAAESYFQSIDFRFTDAKGVKDMLMLGNTPPGTRPEDEQYVEK